MTTTIASVDLSTGVKVDFAEQGDPAGIPLLLLHGYTDSWRSFERVLPLLPQSIHALALSQRGHGDASRPDDGYRPLDFATDVAAFMDALSLKPAVIAGHSMGSFIAQRFAVDHPERTSGLVLMASFAGVRDNPGVLELRDSVANLTDPIDRDFVQAFQESTLARPVPPTFLDTVVRESLKVPARVWRAALAGMVEADHSGDLGAIRAPTLVLWGDRDTLVPRSEQDALAEAIPGSRLVVYPGVGHGLHWEDPERVAADLAAFTQTLAERRAPG
jgi:pimeloyl-ACP methyl ester carboxylesterase